MNKALPIILRTASGHVSTIAGDIVSVARLTHNPNFLHQGSEFWESYAAERGPASAAPEGCGLMVFDYREWRFLHMQRHYIPGLIQDDLFQERALDVEESWPPSAWLGLIAQRRIRPAFWNAMTQTWEGAAEPLSSWSEGVSTRGWVTARSYLLDLSPWRLENFPCNAEGARQFQTRLVELEFCFTNSERKSWQIWIREREA